MPHKDFQPLYLLSIPRSGSTLLQRVLGAHGEICTVAEPWILLPLFYALRREGVYAEYDQHAAAVGISDFLAQIEDGKEVYRKAVSNFSCELYSHHMQKSPGRYFLDKTPRYYYIAEEICETFDQAKYIFLWRNPLAAAASMIETWSKNHFRIYKFIEDLETGLRTLIDVYSDCDRGALSLRYEDFVTDPKGQLDKIWSYLELESDPSVLDAFQYDELKGIMGDPKRVERSRVSDASLNSWVKIMNSPVRRWWCRRYLDRIGENRLHKMGYDREDILRDLYSIPVSYRKLPEDIYYLLKWSFSAAIKKVFRNFQSI